MAGQALSTGTTGRRRVVFGLLDGDGWTWAGLKAAFWFVVIVMMLGYIPDRAYYLTVFPTIDVGLMAWSPINFCPGENRTVPCPAPAGATLPWDPSPAELALPAPRTDGAAVQVGTRMLYVGGSDGKTATDATYLADLYNGTFGPWTDGPKLPAPRTGAATIFLNQSVYVIGGADAGGAPTDTVFVATQDLATGKLGDFTESTVLKLPEARAFASVVATSDGLVVIGGKSAAGPQPTVWKATLDKTAKLGRWEAEAAMPTGIAEASAALVGDHVFVFGGSDPSGPVGLVLRGNLGKEAANLNQIASWDIGGGTTNLPVARTRAAGFTSNSSLYVIGGADATGLHNEMYWTAIDAQGNVAGWQTMAQTDLPVGVAGTAPLISSNHAFLIGGTVSDQPAVTGSARASLAPFAPFFQLGLFGATVPALKIGGEIGQQLGYINAATVGVVNFAILLLIGWAFNHKERTKEIFGRIRGRLRS